jgi:murein DD-endopeptidase MepM/ murein hydrolase activator NlpD
MNLRRHFKEYIDDIYRWRVGWQIYLEKHIRRFSRWFETYKDMVVDILMARRGMYQRPFMHFSLGVLFTAGVLAGPILADTYPGSRLPGDLSTFTPPSAVVSSLDLTEYAVKTQTSEKPRDQVLDYKVVSGDTLSTIASKFDVSIDSIRWANDFSDDTLHAGDIIKIPPVTGIVYKVKEGDTIYGIAKKFKTDAQNIVNFPFNDFADLETYSLTVGQTLIVPDGLMPQSLSLPVPQIAVHPQYSMGSGGGSGQFHWPTNGLITQYPVWYHMALDIANSSQPPVMAAGSGTVILVQYLTYDYGHHVIIDHGNGTSTLYGHMTEIYVHAGDKVSQGQIIGKMGSTGRSTGTHLHFEVRVNGRAVNPLPYLK